MKKPTITIAQWAEKLGVTPVRARILALRVKGAKRIGEGQRATWVIPAGAVDPRLPHGRPKK